MADNFTIESISKTAPWGTAAYGAGLYNGLIYICAIVDNKPNVYTYNPNTGEYATYDLNENHMYMSINIVYYNGAFYSFRYTHDSSENSHGIYRYDINSRTITKNTASTTARTPLYVYENKIRYISFQNSPGSYAFAYVREADPVTLSTAEVSKLSSSGAQAPANAQSSNGFFANFLTVQSGYTLSYQQTYGYMRDDWVRISSFPVNINRYSLVDYDNNYYVCGGQSEATSPDNWSDSLAIYQVNKTTNAVTTCETQLPSAFVNGNAVVVNNVAYLFNSTTVCKLTFTPPAPDPTKKITVNVGKQNTLLKTYNTYCDANILLSLKLQEKSATPSTTAQDITPDSGNCGLSKVSISAIQTEVADVTPSKGTQTVNPTTGKYFSQVVVEPIPDDYIIPSGTQNITENGTYDVTSKANAVVNVPSVTEVATAAEMNALLVAANVGKYYKFTGTTDGTYTKGDIYFVEEG